MLCTADSPAANALPLADALVVLGIDRSTFYRYCQTGQLRKIKHAGKTFVDKEAIEDYWAAIRSDSTRAQARARRSTRARRGTT